MPNFLRFFDVRRKKIYPNLEQYVQGYQRRWVESLQEDYP